MKNKTKEEAYLEMLKPAETITFKVQNCEDELSMIKESCGDGFYIRYLNYSSDNPMSTSVVEELIWVLWNGMKLVWKSL